ncbi:hypothetical protein ACFV27_36885 [Streptomyces antimycoticus]|uniref:hypothetical protein n=1 Tax=Streptomyces antimycoticus TaxID=68175 RepID=UPI003687AADB
MPGALDPAGPTPPPLPDPGRGDVIHLGSRRRRPDRQEPTMADAYGGGPTPEEQLAQIVQSMFLAEGRSLTDPATAQAYDITLRAVLLIIDGAMARAGLPEEHHETLRGMVEQAQQVPRIL